MINRTYPIFRAPEPSPINHKSLPPIEDEDARRERYAREAAELAQRQQDNERAMLRARRQAARAERKGARAARRADPAAVPAWWIRGIVVAIPVVLVNAVAFSGQLAFLRTHLPWPLAGQVMMAVALESIAVYLAYHAHVAQLANDSAMRLRLASYAFALVIAAMNYSHYADHWRPTFAAVALGLMSASSPWLWAIHSRRTSRDVLLAQGLVEHHALRLGSTRWTWHPLRSAKVMWLATWEGITSPADALAAADARQLPVIDLDAATLAAMPARDRLALAFGAVGAVDVPRALALLAEHGVPIDDSYAYQIRKAIADGRPGGEQS